MARSERGATNIRRYNTEREERFIPLIKENLKKCKLRKVQFESLGSLTEYISSVTDIHRTTLTRNPRYKVLLTAHIAAQRGACVPVSLETKLLTAQIEISNLQEKLRRLEVFIAKSGNKPSLDAPKQTSDAAGAQDYLAFTDTAMALAFVLERFKDTIKVDFSKKTIEDLSARPSQRIIAGPERASAYVDWLQEHRKVFLGFNDAPIESKY